MMGNRKQPFGYKMALGEIVIQEAEAKLVQGIFRRYIAGESLNELTEALRQQDIPYDEGRLWNKNMVARILADIRYTGEKGYPKLIDEEQLIAANEKRSNKPQLPKKTEAQKVLRRLCGTPPSEQVEQSVTYLLNGLANYPDRIQHRRSPTPVTYSKTQEALDNTLEQQPIDEDSAKVLILRLAAEQYAALGNEEYETNRLRRLFSAFECAAELNADLLKNTVAPFPSSVFPLADVAFPICPFFRHLCSPFRFGNTNNYHRKAIKSSKFLKISDIFQRFVFQQNSLFFVYCGAVFAPSTSISSPDRSLTLKIM